LQTSYAVFDTQHEANADDYIAVTMIATEAAKEKKADWVTVHVLHF
jgi:hypothetical protein